MLGFDAVATGHHARVERGADGRRPAAARRRPGQGPELRRAHARPGRAGPHAVPGRRASPTRPSCGRWPPTLGLRTAAKPDSQDVCFITSTGGRHEFLRRRLAAAPGATSSTPPARRVGEVAAVELVTIGQRTGLGLPGGGPKRFVRRRRPGGGDRRRRRRARPAATTSRTSPRSTWVDGPVDGDVLVQCSAHGDARPATLGGGDRRRRRPLGDAAAPGRAGPERRVLRPHRPLRARRRHRRPDAAAGPAAAGARAARRRAARRPSRARHVRRARPAAALRGRGASTAVAASRERDLRRPSPGVGPVRSSGAGARGRSPTATAAICRRGSISVSASTTGSWTTSPAGTTTSHRRLSWCQRRGSSHVAAAATTSGDAAEARTRCPATASGAVTHRGDPHRPRHDRRRRGSRAAGAAGSAARRRRPTACT